MFKLTVGLALVTLVACSQCPNNEVCEAGQSCCQDPTGDFSCCPFTHGECCEDHQHCCPEGMLCSVVDLMCINATDTLPLAERIPAKQPDLPKSFRMIPSLPASEYDIICPDGSYCPAEFSCLLMSSSYGCCPVSQGLVCPDGKHCCPNDHECSADSSLCVKQKADTVLCGDGMSECPTDTTCCENADGQWACCPMPKAVCCDDKIHCCPGDSVCDVESSKCLSSTNQELPMWAKFPARLRADWEDHKSAEIRVESEITTTRQITTSGNQMTTLPVSPVSSMYSDVPCNDSTACPDGETCCKTKEGGYACCPLPEAVCCDDFIHCCPHGKKCDVAEGSCVDPSGSVPWVEKRPVKPFSSGDVAVTTVSSTYSDVPCNDSTACPDGETCCKTKEGGWACCPLPEAVCCDDFIHCCPHGKKCDVAEGSCVDPSGSVPWVEKRPVKPFSSGDVAVTTVSSTYSDVPCNDSTACPDGETCCKTKEGGYACCPLPEAVCCDDFIHCCPHGKKCDVAEGSCVDPSGSVPWVEKRPVKPFSSGDVAVTQVSSLYSDVPCNDSTACPDGETCCKTKEGEWACCPLPDAVCCEDFVHCCPHGKICNIAAMTCEDPSCSSEPWVKQMPVLSTVAQNVMNKQNTDVPCNDTAACPDGETCCKTKEGGWACCPLPDAVCCDDFIHCCPHGKTCDVAAESCNDPLGSEPWVEKVPARPRAPQWSPGKMDCDSSHVCPESSTCCQNADGNWGCCPFSEAVCCMDGEHCCPAHYKCDMSSLSCVKEDVVIPWYNKIVAESTPAPNVDLSAVNCDEQSSCSADSTCCRLSTGEWGCCPFSEAVCCPDQKHCCPEGYRCDLRRRSCIKTTRLLVEITQLTQIHGQKPQPSVSAKDIQCGDGYSCHDSETCCPTSQTTWGCCPSPKAVCCDDMQHCCPAGYKCGDGGTCSSALDFDWNNWVNWRVFFSKKKRAIAL